MVCPIFIKFLKQIQHKRNFLIGRWAELGPWEPRRGPSVYFFGGPLLKVSPWGPHGQYNSLTGGSRLGCGMYSNGALFLSWFYS
jgi:hypothetical protein